MSKLQQLVRDVKIEEPEYNSSRLISWSIDDNKLKVECAQDVFLEDYFYIDDDHEVTISALEFTANCTIIYTVLSSDVVLDEDVMISGGEIDSYNEIVNLNDESSDSRYNEKALIADLMDELSNPGPQPTIDMPVPHAIVTFSEL